MVSFETVTNLIEVVFIIIIIILCYKRSDFNKRSTHLDANEKHKRKQLKKEEEDCVYSLDHKVRLLLLHDYTDRLINSSAVDFHVSNRSVE